MKKLILLALAALMVVGCKNIKNGDGTYRVAIPPRTYIIDSCEYIGFVGYGAADIIAHKGNCKFCAERRQTELKELIEQLKKK